MLVYGWLLIQGSFLLQQDAPNIDSLAANNDAIRRGDGLQYRNDVVGRFGVSKILGGSFGHAQKKPLVAVDRLKLRSSLPSPTKLLDDCRAARCAGDAC